MALSPNHPSNDWFEELCALAAIGELSSAEFAELEQHLAECSGCRELSADLRRIASDDMAVAAVQRLAHEGEAYKELAGEPALDEDEMLRRFLERAERERKKGSVANSTSAKERRISADRLLIMSVLDWLRLPSVVYGTVTVVLAAIVGVGAYKLREKQLSPALEQLHSQLIKWRNQAEDTEVQRKSASDLLQHTQSERDALQRSLIEAQARYLELNAEREGLQANLKVVNGRFEGVNREFAAAKAAAEQKDKLVGELQARLQDSTRRGLEQEAVVASLRKKLQQADREGAASVDPAVDEGEAKELLGARDLHTVDVYDVDGNGKTRRTIGRVYYVEKKLLVFYAFDLQDKRRGGLAAGFQAWGYSQGNSSKPENLGLFYVDDASLNRWALKVSDRKILARVDAVFVTLEPSGGSPTPMGRKLLYANLSGPPNHP